MCIEDSLGQATVEQRAEFQSCGIFPQLLYAALNGCRSRSVPDLSRSPTFAPIRPEQTFTLGAANGGFEPNVKMLRFA